jgi:hypothetical protein
MPVVRLDYVPKGAAHTPIRPIQPIKPIPAPGNVHYERFTKGQPPSQEALLAAMQAAVAGGGRSSSGFGAVVDLNTAPEPPPVAARPTVVLDAPPDQWTSSAARYAAEAARTKADLAAQEAVSIQLPLGQRQIIRDANK